MRDLGASAIHAGALRRVLLAGGRVEHAARRGRTLPAHLLTALEERYCWTSLREIARHPCADGAVKHLFALADEQRIEAVALPGSGAPSACLSIQVGCAVGCRFCASGLDGVERNLHAHEILEQVAWLRRHRPVRRLVFMGSGEPTHNLRALDQALRVLAAEGEIGARHVMVSTVGPPAAVDRLSALGRRLTLALSLHALDQDLRGALIPTQAAVDPRQLLDAADRHAAVSGRPYQVEWVLLGGLNDGPTVAADLAQALSGRRAHLSLIPWNPVMECSEYRAPSPRDAEAFLAVIQAAGVSARLRRTLGGDQDAACGQLRRRLGV